MAVAGGSRFERNIDERHSHFRDTFQRPADPQLLAILMQTKSGFAME